jgi:hypothetical protein
MARTIVVAEAVNMVGLRYPRLLTDGFAARFADEVQARIWHRYPWRGTLAELPPFYLIHEVPDYGPPTYAVPTDFYGLHRAWIRNGVNGNVLEPELLVKPEVGISVAPGVPTVIAYHEERFSFRLHPRPSITGPDYWVEGIYKKNPTKITNENLNSHILPWDDQYFEVFKKGLEWKYKDEILGAPDADRSLLLFRAFIDDMAAAEGLHSGVVTVAPAEGLELGG